MFYQECERLANERPVLKELISKIDGVIHSVGLSGVIRPEDIASHLGEKLSQVSGIFSALSDSGLVFEQRFLECPNCYNLIDCESYKKAKDDQDTFECSQCQANIGRQRLNEVRVYRLNPAKTVVSKTPVIKNSVIQAIEDKETNVGSKDLKVKLVSIEKRECDWVRVCLVQMDFSLEISKPPQEFGYVLSGHSKDSVQRKILSALRVAQQEKANIICFPELCLTPEWIRDMARDFVDLVIVGGSYYSNRFNTCSVIISGTKYSVHKIHPSPNAEEEVESARGMKRGKDILVFDTKFGKFVVLICLDYRNEAYRILHHKKKEISNVDFIINPCHNSDVANFQAKANQDCQEGNYPYVLQTNYWSVKEGKPGGTCIVGMDHKNAIKRYEEESYRPQNDPVTYKLLEAHDEMILFADLDISRKGVPVPASGVKMRNVSRYIWQEEGWQKLKEG